MFFFCSDFQENGELLESQQEDENKSILNNSEFKLPFNMNEPEKPSDTIQGVVSVKEAILEDNESTERRRINNKIRSKRTRDRKKQYIEELEHRGI